MIGSIISGLVGKMGSDAAASSVNTATRQAQAATQHQQEVNRSDYSPYTSLGLNATQTIGQLLGFGNLNNPGGEGATYQFDLNNAKQAQDNALKNFYTSPGYQFRLNEGIKALDRSAAAKGMQLSGAQSKAVQAYGQGLASDEYNNWLNNYWQAAGLGKQATDAMSGQNTGLTQVYGQQGMSGANAAAGLTQAGWNTLATGISQGNQNIMNGIMSFFNPMYKGLGAIQPQSQTQTGYRGRIGSGTGEIY